jgi:UrcA family protein
MNTLAKTMTLALATFGLAGAAITPAAAGNVERMTVKVNASDIDFGTAKGLKDLDQRLEKAVRTVCRITSPTTGSRVLSQEVRDCLAQARADVKRQVAVLTTRYEQRGG